MIDSRLVVAWVWDGRKGFEQQVYTERLLATRICGHPHVLQGRCLTSFPNCIRFGVEERNEVG